MELIKIYDPTCDICLMLDGLDADIAEEEGFFFRKIDLETLAKNPSPAREYVKKHYVGSDGMVDIPIYMIMSQQGSVLVDGKVKTIEELKNLIGVYNQVY